MKKNKPFTPAGLAIEIESLIADKDKPQSKSEITAWLVRLYTIAAKLTLIHGVVHFKCSRKFPKNLLN